MNSACPRCGKVIWDDFTAPINLDNLCLCRRVRISWTTSLTTSGTITVNGVPLAQPTPVPHAFYQAFTDEELVP